MPEEDTKYFGSFYDKTFFPTEKTILFTGETRQEAMEIEILLHDFFDVAVNPQFANKAKQTSTKFDSTGVPKTEEWKKAMSGVNNPMYGIPRTEETRRKISAANSGKTRTEETKKKMSAAKSGVLITKETRKKISEAMSGEKNPQFGRTGEKHPQYGRTGALSTRGKAIIAIEPDGTQLHYGSTHQATRELGIDRGTLRYLLKNGHVSIKGKWKGWRFIYKNSTNF